MLEIGGDIPVSYTHLDVYKRQVKGFAVGRTIFMSAAEGWLSGKLDHEAAIADMAKPLEALTGLWLSTRARQAA